jgi:hypothetical protein
MNISRGRTTMQWIGGIALAMGVWLTGAASASADDFDGSKALLCVPTDITSCTGAGDCQRISADQAGIPQFLHLDFEAGTVSGKLKDGEERTAPLGTVSKLETAVVTQGLGADGKRAFSIRVGHDGHLSVGIVDDGGGFLILGACTPR